MIEIIALLITTNLIAAALAVYFWRKSKISKARPESIELQEFLLDLMGHGGMVHVRRIAPADVVLRSRRQ